MENSKINCFRDQFGAWETVSDQLFPPFVSPSLKVVYFIPASYFWNMKFYTLLTTMLIGFSVAFWDCRPSKKATAPDYNPPVNLDERPVEKDPAPAAVTKTDAYLEKLLQSQPQFFNEILKKRDEWNVQIIYTQIDRQANNNPVFKNYYFNVNPDKYRYPASTVKLPVALLALQRLNELKIDGLNPNSTMITEEAYSGQTPVYNDPTAKDGKPSIAQYIKKILLVSDNDAYNRLYEFLGQQYINESLHKMGYPQTDILHRLSIPLSEDENRHTNPANFFNSLGTKLYSQPAQFNSQPYPQRKDAVGKGYYGGGKLVSEPMDFSRKNRFPLEDLHNVLKTVMFPNAVSELQRFNLRNEDYYLVKQYMSQLPGETFFPPYDSSYHDAYVKFLLYGSEKGKLPKHIRIFNKVGDAYGFLTDAAYVVDFEKNIEFMLSATIYCNSDGILNDDKYDYETVGFPFLKQLGKLIYDHESGRQRKHKPDLSLFKMVYDK